ncbi:hypothetical protein FOA52_003760 [Chlamydomonas sp. UWO 241]|nr:hypothetical protein FOA52_003760 [Chlamydomonas sp. UWO 241]
MDTDLNETVSLSFHGVDYELSVSTSNDDTLSIEIEQTMDAARWRGDFTSRYIEDITSKTGNFKKFPVFVKMLLSAVKQASDSVFVDLLTYQDLEVLKTRKMAEAAGSAAPQPPARPALPPSNKRYLILTYAAEFDRVHYPLPLVFEEHPDPEHLRHVIVSLRQELDAARAAGGGGGARGARHNDHGAPPAAAADARRMREENAALRSQLRQLERSVGRSDLAGGGDPASGEARDLSRELRSVRKERDALMGRAEAAEAELERAGGLHRRELRRRAKEAQAVTDELAAARETIRDLRHQVRTLQDALDRAGRDRPSSGAPSGRPRGSGGSAGLAREPAERARAVYGSRGYNGSGGGGASGSFGYHTAGAAAAPRARSRPSSGDPYLRGAGAGSRAEARSRERGGARRSGGSDAYDARGSGGGSRPASAPAARRFDPTEWVRSQAERGRGGIPSASHRGRSSSPAAAGGYSSAGSSARGSPAASRPASAERGGRPVWGAGSGSGAPAASTHSSRPSSAERAGRPTAPPALYGSARAAAAAPGARPPSAERMPRALSGSAGVGSRPTSGSGRPRAASPYSAWGGGGAEAPRPDSRSRNGGGGGDWSKFPRSGSGQRGSGVPGGGIGGSSTSRPASRDSSPGRALQEIKRKLSEYVGSSQGSLPAGVGAGRGGDSAVAGMGGAGRAAGAGSAPAQPAYALSPAASTTTSKAQLFEDTSVEIADIDSRLHALQSFLRMAKGGGGS